MADSLTLPPEVLASLAAKKLGFTTGANTARGQADQGYSDQLYQLDQMNKDQQQTIDDSFADRGTFNSGIRVDSQGRLAKNVGERQGQLGVAHSNALANIQDLLDQELAGVTDTQAQYALDYNRTQAQNALAQAQGAGNMDLQAQIDQLTQQQSALQQPQAAPVDPSVGLLLGGLGSSISTKPKPSKPFQSIF